MEPQRRKNEADQENHVVRIKSKLPMPVTRQDSRVRGHLRDLNTNDRVQRERVRTMVAKSAKAATQYRGSSRSTYSHIKAKVDTGLTAKNVIKPSSHPPITCEDTTTQLAGTSNACTRASLKETQMGSIECSNVQNKKGQESKKLKLPELKNNEENKFKIKEPKEAQEALKLIESDTASNAQNTESENEKKQNDPVVVNYDLDEDPISVYDKDIYRHLIELELKYPIEPDHLKKQSLVTGNTRAIIINWLVDIHSDFVLLLETLHLTVGIIDRYLQAVSDIQLQQFLLVAVTALYIASKYEEIHPPNAAEFVYYIDKTHTKADLFKCEWEILAKLEYCLARPIPLSFLERLFKVGNGSLKLKNLAKYLVELALVDYSMAHYRPSELSAAAVCLAFVLLSDKKTEAIWTSTLCDYSDYSLEHIDPIIRKFARIVINVDNSKCKAVYNKYCNPELTGVSNLPQLEGARINELAKTTTSTFSSSSSS